MRKSKSLGTLFVLLVINCCLSCNQNIEGIFADLIVNSDEVNIECFWKDNEGKVFKSIKKLKNYVEKSGKKLRFAMNGGMYQEDNKPLGLFIQNQQMITPLNVREAKGNFYIKPNGVFYLTIDKKAFLVTTQNFKNDGQINFATQSGPMLLFDGQINPEFKQNSENVNLRNGVCVLEGNKIVFSISRKEVNFYDFAQHLKELGCQDALYLDGFVSRMYLPEKNIEDLDGDFGVIIGITE
ncbi:MAG TPA: phosphodiester glycosidase family protein [Pyrinomonadaceae bacterium]|nr:phosphodiester glycosidase family protein [Pyrinomonadaceae bacterium]